MIDAATFHDLGKLDRDVQSALKRGRGARLHWDHIDAGVAHLRNYGANVAAWIVRAHHAPGLPSLPTHFPSKGAANASNYRKLRGLRRDAGVPSECHQRQIDRTDAQLQYMLAAHEAAVGRYEPARGKRLHGFALRSGLSCLVDADHSDTAGFDTGWSEPEAPQPRWSERLAALDAYVEKLGDRAGQRDALRRDFYQACRHRTPDQAMIACEGPVGIGKTTAITAYLLSRAIATNARRLFVVAPYTAILTQTAKRLRKALVLPDEQDRPDAIVAEHHHRADFADISCRDLATLWNAPIILTTAVQFFETLSSNAPAALRKLHSLPGSVVFLDEAHASLPVSGKRYLLSADTHVETPILKQNWRWLCELADDWSCSFVFASGSLARYWEIDDIVGDATVALRELTPPALAPTLLRGEAGRVSYVSRGRFDGPAPLAAAVAAEPGPRLLIMNTVQSAAVMAKNMGNGGCDVLHLSTALCPRDRDAIFATVEERLDPRAAYSSDWTLVATSLVEAGVDISFRTPFRERFATTSLIQIGGRANRNFEYSEGVAVHDFIVDHDEGLKQHPAAAAGADVLEKLFAEGRLNGDVDPAAVVTLAMRREMKRQSELLSDHLGTAERDCRYPDVNSLGRIIEADTRLVVVDPALRKRVESREKISTRELLAGSVQIWARKISALKLEQIDGRRELYWWPYDYDAGFLGYMAGVLDLLEKERDVVII